MLQYSADDILDAVRTNSDDLDNQYKIITELKAHIKRDFVDLPQVPGYFEALKIANKSPDFKLSSLAFSCVCHLVKRVGMQDPTSLRNSSKIVLPLLVNRLLDPKSSLKSQAKSSLETFWLAAPSIVESYIRDTTLIHSNHKIRSESIIFISDLIELNKNFDFLSFLPNLVNLLRDDSIEVVKNVEVLLLKYFTFHKSKLNELVSEFKNQKLEARKAARILRDLDSSAANLYLAEAKAQAKPTIDTASNLSKTRRPISSQVRSTSTSSTSASQEIPDILAKIPTAKIDESISPITVRNADELNREIEKLSIPFQGKETEFNWNAREKSIIRFRGLIAGNYEQFPDELVQSIRTLQDGINKSTMSLRTTLSSNGCQLIKELAVYLTKGIDPLAENLFQPLASLTSATKKITSLNSFGSISVLLTNTSFNNRLLNQCFQLYQDKNIQPRLYSSTFLQIFILKHGSKLDQTNLEMISKWLGKGVADPNTTVRESMRTTFWIFSKKFKELSETIFSKLDANVQKNLERSKPKDVSVGNSTGKSSSLSKSSAQPEKKRQSIKEFVAAQKRERRSISGPNSTTSIQEQTQPQKPTQTSLSDIGRPNRIGVPQRVRAVSGEYAPLQRQTSRGSSDQLVQRNSYQQLNNQISASSSKDTVISQEVDENTVIESLKKLLKSPLTRERNEGVQELERLLFEEKETLPDLTSTLFNLVVLDTHLLKPLLKIPKFFKLVDVSLALKVLAVNKSDISVISKVHNPNQIISGLCSMIVTLESLKFDNAPSTMFHIKYKNQFLDYSISNIYTVLASDENHYLNSDKDFIKNVCKVIFPLCISDYPKYDELILHLNSSQPELFQEGLDSATPYIKSKINSILDEFKDNNIAEIDNHEMSFTDHALKDMTMINPMNKNPNDPTVSLKVGFKTDMTMILPNFKVPTSIPKTETKDLEKMDVDVEEIHDVDEVKEDFMGDIFNTSKEKLQVDDSEKMDIDDKTQSKPVEEAIISKVVDIPILTKTEHIRDINREPTESPISQSHSPSPFMDSESEDDRIIVNRSTVDEATEKLTSKIGEIYISPEKFKAPDRKSLSNIIDQTDPFFSKTKKHIEIFQDSPKKSEVADQRLINLELSKFDLVKESKDVTVENIKEMIKLLHEDKVSNRDLNSLIKYLHQSISNENILFWIRKSGFNDITSAMIHYFNNSINITEQLCFKGLIIFKELLIVSEYLDNIVQLPAVFEIFSILNMVVENLKSFKSHIFITVDELVDDLIELNIENLKSEFIKNCCLSLKNEKDHAISISFNLLTLTKCIEREDLTVQQIKEIDSTVFKFISSNEVEVRRLTIIVYSKCKKNLHEYDQNSKGNKAGITDDNSKKIAQDTYNDVFQKFSLPQKKLVDYYCEN